MTPDPAEAARPLRERHAIPSAPGEDKVLPLAAAVRRFVRPGAVLHVAYSDARPNAALMEVVRQFDGTSPGFTLSTSGLVSLQHALVARGLVSKLITSFAGENYPAPRPNPIFQRAVAEGRVEIENWSLWTLIARLVGGALGTEFFPVSSLRGSDLEKEHLGSRYARVASPFGDGEATGVVRSHRPDIVLLQGVAADPHGNVVMAAPFGEAYWGSLAAREGVIACVERVMSAEAIRASNELVTIPAHVVRAVCEVPFGSHPYGMYNPGLQGVGSYVEDHDFIVELQQTSRDPAAFDRWIDEWVLAAPGHDHYLRRLGPRRLSQLRGDANPDSWELQELEQHDTPDDGESSDAERMVVATAHMLAERITERDHHAILAGVGFSNLAAWLASRTLREAGRDVQLMAEIGMFGYHPRPGEPFIFSLRNLPSCSLLTDVMAVLGTFVSGPTTRCIGAVGAGQIDRGGNINSTWAADGRFLVGSGGANDIGSTADEVVVAVKHRPGRLVESVPYVTSPGERVRAIVTTEGVLERAGGEFELRRYFPRPGESERDAVERILGLTGWELKVSEELAPEPAPTAAELRVIRDFDPRRVFLR
jgi:acyl CoA:acetate/3-ketoacid CoA transferase alpha subunit/acyl CoA:acetate/3-ketoacid CoA transferase beta subunit